MHAFELLCSNASVLTFSFWLDSSLGLITILPMHCLVFRSTAGTGGTAIARAFLRVPLEHWKRVVLQGVIASVAPSTLRSYKKAWADFIKFHTPFLQITASQPPTTVHALKYLAHFFEHGQAAKTLKIQSAAITFFSKSIFLKDPCTEFIVCRVLERWGRLQEGWGQALSETSHFRPTLKNT